MTESKKIAAAVAYYDSLVEEAVGDLPSIVDEMAESCRAGKLTFGGRSMFNVLRPNFITERQYSYFSKVCLNLRNAISKFKQAALLDEGFMSQVGLLPTERSLVDIDPGFDRLSITARWDSFLLDDELKFVELNAECPAGLAYQEVAVGIYKNLPFVKTFSKAYRIRKHTMRRTLLNELLSTYKSWRGTKSGRKPVIAIVDWKEVPTFTEFQLFQEFFSAAGYPSVIADPRDLEFDGSQLKLNGRGIDIVYKRVLTNDCVQRPMETKALVDACRGQKVCMINPFRAKMVHKKAIFAVLTHEKNAHLFNKSELRAIGRHIPWTRMLSNEHTTINNRRVDLANHVVDHKDDFVLKPNDEYGGQGVTLGKETSQGEWEKRVVGAISDGNYIIQQLVGIPKSKFPTFDHGLKYVDFVVDLDPYVFGAKLEGVLTRLSASSLANVTAGGGTTPTFVIDKIVKGAKPKTKTPLKSGRKKR